MRVDVRQARAAGLPRPGVGPADRGHQQLDGLADLPAQRLGDLLLGVLAAGQQRTELLALRHGEEPAPAQQRDERPDHVPFRELGPGDGVEHGGAGHSPARRPHQRPPPAVGGQAELDVVVAAQVREPVDRGGRPRLAGDPRGGLRAGCADRAEQPGGGGCDIRTGFGQRERRHDPGVVLGDVHAQDVEAIGAAGHLVQGLGPAEQLAQHVADPGLLPAGGVGLPGGVSAAQPLPGRLVQRVQGGPGGAQHRQRQERAAHLDQAQPGAVLLGAVRRVRAAGTVRTHRMASRSGTTTPRARDIRAL